MLSHIIILVSLTIFKIYDVTLYVSLFIEHEENKKLDKRKRKIKSRNIYKNKNKIKYNNSSILWYMDTGYTLQDKSTVYTLQWEYS